MKLINQEVMTTELLDRHPKVKGQIVWTGHLHPYQTTLSTKQGHLVYLSGLDRDIYNRTVIS